VVSDPNWGYIVEADCGDCTIRYCGLLQGTTPKIGMVISQGDSVGKVGRIPCESAQESHVHIEVLKADDRLNPQNIFG
jgi:hypothetical protein